MGWAAWMSLVVHTMMSCWLTLVALATRVANVAFSAVQIGRAKLYRGNRAAKSIAITTGRRPLRLGDCRFAATNNERVAHP